MPYRRPAHRHSSLPLVSRLPACFHYAFYPCYPCYSSYPQCPFNPFNPKHTALPKSGNGQVAKVGKQGVKRQELVRDEPVPVAVFKDGPENDVEHWGLKSA